MSISPPKRREKGRTLGLSQTCCHVQSKTISGNAGTWIVMNYTAQRSNNIRGSIIDVGN